MPKVRLRISWTEVIPRSTDVVVDMTAEQLRDVEEGWDINRWKDSVREVEGDVGMLFDEIDYIEVLNRRVRSKKNATATVADA
jgi:hypothetical protein